MGSGPPGLPPAGLLEEAWLGREPPESPRPAPAENGSTQARPSPLRNRKAELGMPNPVARDSRATGSSWPPRPRRLGCTTPEQTVRRQNQPRTPEGCSRTHSRPPDPRATDGRKRCIASKTQTHRARERTPRLTGRAPQMSVGRENPPALCTQAKAVGSLAPGPKASEGGDRARRRGRRRPWG